MEKGRTFLFALYYGISMSNTISTWEDQLLEYAIGGWTIDECFVASHCDLPVPVTVLVEVGVGGCFQ